MDLLTPSRRSTRALPLAQSAIKPSAATPNAFSMSTLNLSSKPLIPSTDIRPKKTQQRHSKRTSKNASLLTATATATDTMLSAALDKALVLQQHHHQHHQQQPRSLVDVFEKENQEELYMNGEEERGDLAVDHCKECHVLREQLLNAHEETEDCKAKFNAVQEEGKQIYKAYEAQMSAVHQQSHINASLKEENKILRNEMVSVQQQMQQLSLAPPRTPRTPKHRGRGGDLERENQELREKLALAQEREAALTVTNAQFLHQVEGVRAELVEVKNEHSELVAFLQEERNVTVEQSNELEAKLAAAEDREAKLQETVAKLQQELAATNVRVATNADSEQLAMQLKVDLTNAELRERELRAALTQATTTLQAHETKLNGFKDIKRELSTVASERRALEGRALQAEAALLQARKDNSTLNMQVSAEMEKVGVAEAAAAAVERMHAHTRQLLHSTAQELNEAREVEAVYRSRTARAEGKCTGLQIEIQQLSEQLEKQRHAVAITQHETRTYLNKCQEAEQRVGEAEEKVKVAISKAALATQYYAKAREQVEQCIAACRAPSHHDYHKAMKAKCEVEMELLESRGREQRAVDKQREVRQLLVVAHHKHEHRHTILANLALNHQQHAQGLAQLLSTIEASLLAHRAVIDHHPQLAALLDNLSHTLQVHRNNNTPATTTTTTTTTKMDTLPTSTNATIPAPLPPATSPVPLLDTEAGFDFFFRSEHIEQTTSGNGNGKGNGKGSENEVTEKRDGNEVEEESD